MSKKLPMDMFKWSENISYFNEDYLKNYHQDSDVGWLLYVGIKYSEQLEIHIMICLFFLKKNDNMEMSKTCLSFK